ncbi:MAG: tRNA uridine-5-carboxymethylaminomethyl(34) synthesis GTPase MnmE [Bdellovibrionaceae bacterium]|nr:tRNA uridine-5-carboxymethylaminomethyl(34) synthesis GTPase MnmE [Pseudobdellovibrionaceae bacterium]
MNSMIGDRDRDTICAVSTPPGVGGISVIRLSGPKALSLIRQAAPFLPSHLESHRVYYGIFQQPRTQKSIDEVLVTWFERGRSFTGEETAEISCHGNPLICRDILETLVELGARPADRGEFTYRAFMNQRIDLVQAESVLALIESRSSAASRLALRQLQGELSRRLSEIESDITWALAHIEASIDFSTEGLEVVETQVLDARLEKVETSLQSLVASFQRGRVMKDGLRIALSGRPNVGKSSLLNNFLEEDRAIVTEIAGTTRDVVEGETEIDGIRLVFLDTAGLRDADDRVERLGIEKSRKAQAEADLVFFVFDATEGWQAADEALASELDPKRTVLLANKSDLLSAETKRRLEERLASSVFFTSIPGKAIEKVFFVSALDKTTRYQVLHDLAGRFQAEQAETSATLSSARHYERLLKALGNVRLSREQVKAGLGSEFIAVDLKESLLAVQETLGKRFDDQIMDRVFQEFCIGK